MKIEINKGYTEVIIDGNCSMERFYKIADILHTTLGISFKNKISDLDSCYWDFIYKETTLTLHYNTYAGISVFPKFLTNATSLDNQIVVEVYQALFNG